MVRIKAKRRKKSFRQSPLVWGYLEWALLWYGVIRALHLSAIRRAVMSDTVQAVRRTRYE